jgi:hypothetical protein
MDYAGVQMRIWSLHPKYLDSKGAVAMWREGLLARKVLLGQTKGYTNHPQLNRFKSSSKPIALLDNILFELADYFNNTYNFKFDMNKIECNEIVDPLTVSICQLNYEFWHLQNKLFLRSRHQFFKNLNDSQIQPNQIFNIVGGPIADWEKIND